MPFLINPYWSSGTSSFRFFTLVPDPPAAPNLVTFVGDNVLGYHFDLDMAAKVTSVGLYTTALDHTIGIWDANNYSDGNPFLGALLWQKQVIAPATGQLIGSYLFIDTPDGPTLQANHKYVVATTWGEEPVPYKLNAGQFVPHSGTRVGRVADTVDPVFDGLLVDLSDPIIAESYTPNDSQVIGPIGYLTVNLQFTPIV